MQQMPKKLTAGYPTVGSLSYGQKFLTPQLGSDAIEVHTDTISSSATTGPLAPAGLVERTAGEAPRLLSAIFMRKTPYAYKI